MTNQLLVRITCTYDQPTVRQTGNERHRFLTLKQGVLPQKLLLTQFDPVIAWRLFYPLART
jgi:hypothetical protein